MIVSFRDKRTRELAEGKRVKAFSGFERKAELKLDQLESATSLLDLSVYQGTVSKLSRGIAKASTASASMTNGGYALSGPKEAPDQSMLK